MQTYTSVATKTPQMFFMKELVDTFELPPSLLPGPDSSENHMLFTAEHELCKRLEGTYQEKHGCYIVVIVRVTGVSSLGLLLSAEAAEEPGRARFRATFVAAVCRPLDDEVVDATVVMTEIGGGFVAAAPPLMITVQADEMPDGYEVDPESEDDRMNIRLVDTVGDAKRGAVHRGALVRLRIVRSEAFRSPHQRQMIGPLSSCPIECVGRCVFMHKALGVPFTPYIS